jgi:hypothetical protein
VYRYHFDHFVFQGNPIPGPGQRLAGRQGKMGRPLSPKQKNPQETEIVKSKKLRLCVLGIKKPGDDLLSHIECSTIGAGGLNDRVRDGNGCGPAAKVTRLNNLEEYCSLPEDHYPQETMLMAERRFS